MTPDGKAISLWKTDDKHQGIWATHELRTIRGINLLMLALFRNSLQGAGLPALRQSLGLVIPVRVDSLIKPAIGVTIRR